MSSEMRVCSHSTTEFEFYRVSAKTAPFSEVTRKVIGYYPYENVALEATRIVRENNMQRLPGGIDVFCDRFRGTVKDLSGVVYKTDIDLDERDRLLSLRFNKTVFKPSLSESSGTAKREFSEVESSDEEDNASHKRQKTEVTPWYVTSTFNPELMGVKFAQGVQSAQKYAQEHYGSDTQNIKITFHGTGLCAMSLTHRPVNPIELQEITLMLDTDQADSIPRYEKIGTVLPEKDHLVTLKTSDEIANEIISLIDQAFEQNPALKIWANPSV